MVLLMELYLNLNKLAEAKELYNNIANNSEFSIDKYKIIKMAEVIAKFESVESKFLYYLIVINSSIN